MMGVNQLLDSNFVGTDFIESNRNLINCIVLIFQNLPREMLELILLKSMVGIMSLEWMATVRNNESISGSYKLYVTVSNKTWMSASISLKSVTYQWMHGRYRNEGVALKTCKFHFS